ncbi:MAG: hypothetical protein C0467_14345 [Planctomycetaceae bacterium]|nr:hypothetical protein [Planctomycetaceae bacterium]
MAHDCSLEPFLRAVEPAARLVTERHLRQVLHHLIDWGTPVPTNTNLPLWVSRADLLAADALPAHVMAGTEPVLLLITDPNDRMIQRRPRPDQLRVYWEVLFQAAILQKVDHNLQSGSLTLADCTARLNRFGPAVGREIRYVLESEHLVAPESDDAALYRAFAATYLSMAAFDHERLEAFFPSLPQRPTVGRMLTENVNAVELLERTCPAGTSLPPREPQPDEVWAGAAPAGLIAPLADSSQTLADFLRWFREKGFQPPGAESKPAPKIGAPSEVSAGIASSAAVAVPTGESGGVLGRALAAEQKGNNVRAAILRAEFAATATGEQKELALAGARSSLGKLVDSLGDMFAWDDDTRQEWRQALAPVLDSARSGVWPRALRCLYELQKLPVELSREVYAVDLAETIRTFGKRPVKRSLPRAKPVLILMGLRRAHTQLIRVALAPPALLRIDRLFHHQLHDLEHKIRHDFTPIIATALVDAGFIATNTVEEVARDKLIAELIDRVCSRGYLRIGDLRDAIARNRLKMPDLHSAGEFLTGDPLLKADLNLAYSLDGIYRKGEFYLRWLQRASSLFFANPVGRALFLFLILPFAGAFMAVVGAQEMSHIGEKIYSFAAKLVAGKPSAAPAPTAPPPPAPVATDVVIPVVLPPDGKATSDEVEVDEVTGDYIWEDAPHPANLVRNVLIPSQVSLTKEGSHGHFHVPWDWVGGLSVFLFLVIHAPPFRRAVGSAVSYLWWATREILWGIPMRVWRSRVVRDVRLSRPVRLLRRYFWSPLLITLILFGAMFLFGTNPKFLARWGWAFWAGLTLAYNTPWGWVLQDHIAEAVSDWWRVVRVNLIPGILATIMDWFRRLGNWVERCLYAVDERLRFRGGDSQGSFVSKALLGLFWFPIAYVFRFAFNLLLEPQINPVKHFPVVTVSHKLLLPLVPSFGELLAKMTGWGIAEANVWAFSLIACVPGIFGFIAWELLANWRLYAANRPDKLKPVTLGSHGESMRGLLRPGFHSGTIPKLFRKLRHSHIEKSGRLHHDLDHAAEGVHWFVERELVHLLSHAPAWGGIPLQVGAVRFGCQRVTVELLASSLGRDSFILGFENVCGTIEAHIDQIGWVDKLTEPQRAAFVASLRGMLDMGATDRVNGNDRSDDATPTTDLADLPRRVSWDEWGQRWNVGAKPPA